MKFFYRIRDLSVRLNYNYIAGGACLAILVVMLAWIMYLAVQDYEAGEVADAHAQAAQQVTVQRLVAAEDRAARRACASKKLALLKYNDDANGTPSWMLAGDTVTLRVSCGDVATGIVERVLTVIVELP